MSIGDLTKPGSNDAKHRQTRREANRAKANLQQARAILRKLANEGWHIQPMPGHGNWVATKENRNG